MCLHSSQRLNGLALSVYTALHRANGPVCMFTLSYDAAGVRVECGVTLSNEQLRGYRVFSIIDGSLTSFIAMSFFWSGLVDLRLMREDRKWLWLSEALTLAAIVTAYVKGNESSVCLLIFTAFSFTRHHQTCNADVSFWIVYVGAIAFGCGSFLLMQVYKIVRTRSAPGIGWLVLGGLVGGGCALGTVPTNTLFWVRKHG